ncbi:MAG TPA: hypothetical protein VGF77_16765 [Allosphingosinicella sp.]|jgi:hypothetical protein
MKRVTGIAALLAAAAALSACGARRDPNMPTPEENHLLDNAAEMLDSPDTLVANEDVAPGNEDDVPAGDADANGAGNEVGNGQ